jgi:hypothetical protein
MDRAAAAKIGGMDRQTLRDWVHRFHASGPDAWRKLIAKPETIASTGMRDWAHVGQPQ